jgi:hypothetical protein
VTNLSREIPDAEFVAYTSRQIAKNMSEEMRELHQETYGARNVCENGSLRTLREMTKIAVGEDVIPDYMTGISLSELYELRKKWQRAMKQVDFDGGFLERDKHKIRLKLNKMYAKEYDKICGEARSNWENFQKSQRSEFETPESMDPFIELDLDNLEGENLEAFNAAMETVKWLEEQELLRMDGEPEEQFWDETYLDSDADNDGPLQISDDDLPF